LQYDFAGQQPYSNTSVLLSSLNRFSKQLDPLQQSLPQRFFRLQRFFFFFAPLLDNETGDRESATSPAMSERRGDAAPVNERARESKRDASKSHLVPALPVSFGGQPTVSVEFAQRVR
jgi:hypothetical protein